MISLRNFRYVALIEATSFLVLLFFSVINRTESMISIIGPLHGFFFVVYVGMALMLRPETRWTNEQTLLILIGAVLPFGGYVVDWWLTKRWVPPAA